MPIFLLGILPVPTDFQDFRALSVTVLSNTVASNHMRLLSAKSGWSKLGHEEYKIHLEFRRLGVKKGKQKIIIFFLLIACWNGNILDRSG